MVTYEEAGRVYAIVFLLVFGTKYAIHAGICGGEEQTACKTFVTANDAVAREFGSIQEIKPGGGGSRKFGRNPSGRIAFHVTGTQMQDYLSVSWTRQGKSIAVTQITRPWGFWGQVPLWPEYRPPSEEILLPFRTWYKLWYALEVLVPTLIIAPMVLRGMVCARYMKAARAEMACSIFS